MRVSTRQEVGLSPNEQLTKNHDFLIQVMGGSAIIEKWYGRVLDCKDSTIAAPLLQTPVQVVHIELRKERVIRPCLVRMSVFALRNIR